MDEFEDISGSSSAAIPSDEDSDSAVQDVQDQIEQSFDEVDIRFDTVDGKLEAITHDVGVLAASSSDPGSDLDYTEQLDGIAQNLALNNLLIVVLLVSVFLSAGIIFGNGLVRWFRYER